MTVIEFQNVSKKFHKKGFLLSRKDYFWAVRDLSFKIESGETVGLMGANGAGKTTVMRLASRILHPTTGEIRVMGKVMPLLGLEGCLYPFLAGNENIWLWMSLVGASRSDRKKARREIAEFSGLGDFLEMPIKNYSDGMRSRLAFSIAAHLPSDILLIDEALAVGDADFQKRSLNKIREMKNAGKTIFLVSHRMEEITAVCDRLLLLERGVLCSQRRENEKKNQAEPDTIDAITRIFPSRMSRGGS